MRVFAPQRTSHGRHSGARTQTRDSEKRGTASDFNGRNGRDTEREGERDRKGEEGEEGEGRGERGERGKRRKEEESKRREIAEDSKLKKNGLDRNVCLCGLASRLFYPTPRPTSFFSITSLHF